MKKSYMLKKNKEFRYVYKRGTSYASGSMILICIKNKQGPRFGFSVNKKLGKAVRRNRVKRLMREAASFYLPQIRADQSYHFIARTRIVGMPLCEIRRDMGALLQRAGLLENSP